MANTQSPKSDPTQTSLPEQPVSPVPHKPLTAGQQAMLTIKLVAGAALIIALFWIIDSAV